MSLDPELAKTLMSDVPQLRGFMAHLKEEIATLNDLSALKAKANIDLIVEVRARERAIDVLIAILAPLQLVDNRPLTPPANEFAM